jgi:hypothetical protein
MSVPPPVTMVYYGWPKVRDPKKNAAEYRLA